MQSPSDCRASATSPTNEQTESSQNTPLQNSDMNQYSEIEGISENIPVGWFGSLGSDLKNMATCFKDNTLPVLGGVADLVHQTALSVAAEISQLEQVGDVFDTDEDIEDEQGIQAAVFDPLPLPWEVYQGRKEDGSSAYIVDEELLDRILSLSLHEKTFLEQPNPEVSLGDSPFDLSVVRIDLIRRLLDIDENLSAMQNRLSGRYEGQETEFWRNYFSRCESLREEVFESRRLKNLSCQDTHQPKKNDSIQKERNIREISSDDDSSLVPASLADDSSYVNVIPSAPNSLNTFVSTKSVEDLVVVVNGGDQD